MDMVYIPKDCGMFTMHAFSQSFCYMIYGFLHHISCGFDKATDKSILFQKYFDFILFCFQSFCTIRIKVTSCTFLDRNLHTHWLS